MKHRKPRPPTPPGPDLDRRFEGRARLEQLLKDAGVTADAEDIAEAFRSAQKDHAPASAVINALFEDEPRFGSPHEARALFSNLLALWDLIETGVAVDLAAPAERPKPPPPPPIPKFFPKEGPDDAWVEGAWRWLSATPFKELQKLRHAYEHRADSLVSWLDEQGISELAFAHAQPLLFELFAMLELGCPKGLGRCEVPVVGDEVISVPPALAAYAGEAVFEAEHDDEDPLPQEEARRLESLMGQALGALWKARKE